MIYFKLGLLLHNNSKVFSWFLDHVLQKNESSPRQSPVWVLDIAFEDIDLLYLPY